MSATAKKEHKSNRPARGGLSTFVEAIRQGLWEEMERDPTVFVIGEDVGVYGGAFKVTDGLLDEFGEGRVIDTPISEAAIVGAACGAALMGMRPVAEIMFSDFLACCWDYLANEIPKARYMTGGQVTVPLVVRTADAVPVPIRSVTIPSRFCASCVSFRRTSSVSWAIASL